MTTTKRNPSTTRRPFAHAADLPSAYQGLAELFRDWKKRSPWPFAHLPEASEVPHLSMLALLQDAAEIETIAANLREAAARVHTATHGRRSTARYLAQLRREARARKAA